MKFLFTPPAHDKPKFEPSLLEICPHTTLRPLIDHDIISDKPVVGRFDCELCGDSINENHHADLFLEILFFIRKKYATLAFVIPMELIMWWYKLLEKNSFETKQNGLPVA